MMRWLPLVLLIILAGFPSPAPRPLPTEAPAPVPAPTPTPSPLPPQAWTWILPRAAWAQNVVGTTIRANDVTGAYIRAPRLTQAQRDASTHSAGEMIFCTDCAPADLYVYNGTAWQAVSGGGGGGGAPPGGPTGSVQYNAGGATFGGEAALTWNAAQDRLGVGTAAPETRLHVVATGAVPLRAERLTTDDNTAQDVLVATRSSSDATVSEGFGSQLVMGYRKSGDTTDRPLARLSATLGVDEHSRLWFYRFQDGQPVAALLLDVTGAYIGESPLVVTSPGAGTGAELHLREGASGNDAIVFRAPTTLTASRTFIWPNSTGTTGQVLTTDGANPAQLAWATVSGGGGGAVNTVTGTANQVTASPTTGDVVLSLPQNVHTGATPTFSGLTILDQGGLILREATGGGTEAITLRAPAALAASVTYTVPPVGVAGQFLRLGALGAWEWADPPGAGSGSPGGAAGAVQFNSAGLFGGDSAFLWDNTNKRLSLGGSTGAAGLNVRVTAGNSAVFERVAAGNSAVVATNRMTAIAPGQMNDGFGAFMDFTVTDLDAVANNVVRQQGVRFDGNDGTGQFQLQTATAGTLATRLTADYQAVSTYVPRRHYNAAGTAYVGFAAPASPTTHTYTLPTAAGTTGQVLQLGASNQLQWATVASGSGPTMHVASILDFGAVSGGGSTAANNAAFTNAMASLPAVGGVLYIPSGTYDISAEVVIAKRLKVMGEGFASVVRATVAGQNMFNVTQLDGVSFQDFTIESTVTKTDGRGIMFQGTPVCVSPETGATGGNIVHNMRIHSQWIGVEDLSSCVFTMTNTYVEDFRSIGLRVAHLTSANINASSVRIMGNSISSLLANVIAFKFEGGCATSVTGNHFFANLTTSSTPTVDVAVNAITSGCDGFHFANNQIESEGSASGLHVRITGGAGTYGLNGVTINGNWIMGRGAAVTVNGRSGQTCTGAGNIPCLNDVRITNNALSLWSTSGTTACVSADSVFGLVVVGNTCAIVSGSGSRRGIQLGALVYGVTITGNQLTAAAGTTFDYGVWNASIGTRVSIMDMGANGGAWVVAVGGGGTHKVVSYSGMLQADVLAMGGESGSMVWCADCRAGSGTNCPAPLSTDGAFAVKYGHGSWVC